MSYSEKDFKETFDDWVAGMFQAERRDPVMLILPGKFKGFEKLVTARIALEDVVEKGFEELVNYKDDHVKILVTPKRGLLAA